MSVPAVRRGSPRLVTHAVTSPPWPASFVADVQAVSDCHLAGGKNTEVKFGFLGKSEALVTQKKGSACFVLKFPNKIAMVWQAEWLVLNTFLKQILLMYLKGRVSKVETQKEKREGGRSSVCWFMP